MGLEGGARSSVFVKTLGGLLVPKEASGRIFEDSIGVVVGRGIKSNYGLMSNKVGSS